MQTFNLDLSVRGVVPLLYAKQGDVGRKFKVILTDGGKAYPVPDGADVSVWYSGASGVGNYTKIDTDSAVSIAENEITVELISQMLNNAGEGTVCLIMTAVDGHRLGTWNITYIVQAVPGVGSKPAEQYFSVIDGCIEKAIGKKALVKTVNGKMPDENGNVALEDLISPTANVKDTFGGVVITITDKNGTTTAKVKDGENGMTPIKGVDYFTKADVVEIAEHAAGLVEVPSDDHINSLIDAKLGVIENGTY